MPSGETALVTLSTGFWPWGKPAQSRPRATPSSAPEHGDACVNSVQDRGSTPLASSLRFFGEKTSAWQAFRRAKLKLFMVRSAIKSGGCHAIARQRDGGPHPRCTPYPSNAHKLGQPQTLKHFAIFPFPTISPAKGSFRIPKKPKILTDTNVTFRLPLDS